MKVSIMKFGMHGYLFQLKQFYNVVLHNFTKYGYTGMFLLLHIYLSIEYIYNREIQMQRFGRHSWVSHIVLNLEQKQEELISINTNDVKVELRFNSMLSDDGLAKSIKRRAD